MFKKFFRNIILMQVLFTFVSLFIVYFYGKGLSINIISIISGIIISTLNFFLLYMFVKSMIFGNMKRKIIFSSIFMVKLILLTFIFYEILVKKIFIVNVKVFILSFSFILISIILSSLSKDIREFNFLEQIKE